MTKREQLREEINTLTGKQREMLETAGKDAQNPELAKITDAQIGEMREMSGKVVQLMRLEEIEVMNEQLEAAGKRRELIDALPVDGGKAGDVQRYEGKSFAEGLAEDDNWKRHTFEKDGKQVTDFYAMGRNEERRFISRVSPIGVMNPNANVIVDASGKILIHPDYQGKTLTTSAGIAPFSYPVAGYTMIPQENPQLLDIITQESNDNQKYVFLRQATNTNSAQVVAEAGTKPEGGLTATFIEKKFNVIAEYFNVTEQDLRFVPNAMNIFQQQGVLHNRQIVQNQIINGSGDGSADTGMEGILNATGVLTNSTNGAAGPTAVQLAGERMAYGVAKVNSYSFAAANVAFCNAMVLNPQDLISMKLARNTLYNYIWETDDQFKGFVGVRNMIQTGYLAQGTGIVGDFTAEKIVFAWSGQAGVQVVVGYLANDFASNKRTIRFEAWGVSAIKQPSAFCKVTLGI